MASARVMLECPSCRRIQRLKNEKCGRCDKDLRRLREKKYWVDYHDPQGRQRRERVQGTFTDAEDRAKELATDIRRGHYFRDDILFKDLADSYLKSPKTRSLKSYRSIQIALKRVLPFFGHLPVFKITPDLVNSYLQQRIKEKSNRKKLTSPCSANREVMYMRSIFSWGICKRYYFEDSFREKEGQISR